MTKLSGIVSAFCIVLLCSGVLLADEAATGRNYDIASAGTRQLEWETNSGPGVIRVLLEEANLGSAGAEIIEIDFPPGYESRSHFHELEILYVIEGELEHIVSGESRTLKPGMIGIVRYPDEVIHKTRPDSGAKVLVIWPLGNELKGLEGMKETPIQ
jgi:quercetin dioxygenase-like cupin family protein